MAVRIIKNNTQFQYILRDLGDALIPINGAIDVGGDENRLIQLASSAELISILSSHQGQIYVNDGNRDYGYIEGIDLILRINPPSSPTELDPQGRWIVRSDSRRKDYDIVFQGAGDDLAHNTIGTGVNFRFDFNDTTTGQFVAAPEGFLRKRVQWNFIDLVYMKGGTIYFQNMPQGSYMDFYLTSPPGYPYSVKNINSTGDIVRSTRVASAYTMWVHWVIKHWVEGTNLSTIVSESAADMPSYPFMGYSAEITIPIEAGVTTFPAHGHWVLQFYRNRTVVF